jgi:transposase
VNRKIFVERHLPSLELESLIRHEKDKRILERLIFIRTLYDGEDVETAVKRLGRCKVTGYSWLRSWNNDGLEGLTPDFTRAGRPPKLSQEDKEKLKTILRARESWTSREAGRVIKETFGVDYSDRNVKRVLKSLGLRYCKPYPRDYRRPVDAEERLRRSVEEALEPGEGFILGFLDECSPQTDSNTRRVWGYGKPRVTKNTTKYRANTFGFYSPAGISVLCFKDDSRKESVCEFLEEVRSRNPGAEIMMVLDNFRSHRAALTQVKAAELDIRLVYLPPYSPDLNPIEQLWRCLKRELSTSFFSTREEFLRLIEEAYNGLSKGVSFALGWYQKFLPEQFKQFCPTL